jgi:hypothetical protein
MRVRSRYNNNAEIGKSFAESRGDEKNRWKDCWESFEESRERSVLVSGLHSSVTNQP